MGQEWEPSKFREIKISIKDTIIKAHVLKHAPKRFKLKQQIRYYWFDKMMINSNLGGYHGKLLNGDYTLFVENKMRIEGGFKLGAMNGLWTEWDLNGIIKKQLNWKNGELKEVKYFSRGNRKDSTFSYRFNKKHGKFKTYDEGGQLSSKGKFKNGKLNGSYWEYENGKPLKSIYKDGIKLNSLKSIESKIEEKEKFILKEHFRFLKKKNANSKGKVKEETKKEDLFKKWFSRKEKPG